MHQRNKKKTLWRKTVTVLFFWFCVCLRSEMFTSESEDELSLSNWFGRSSLLCLCKWRLASINRDPVDGKHTKHYETPIFQKFFGVKKNHGKFGDQHLRFPWFPFLSSCTLGWMLVTRKVQLDTWYGLLRVYLICVFFFSFRSDLYILGMSWLLFFCQYRSWDCFVNIYMLSDSKAKVVQVADQVLFRSFGTLVTPFKDVFFAYQLIKCQGCILAVLTVYRLTADVNPWPLEMPIGIYTPWRTYIYMYIYTYIYIFIYLIHRGMHNYPIQHIDISKFQSRSLR